MLCLTIARNRHKSMIAEYQQAALEGAPLVELCLDSIHGSVNLKRLLEVKATPVLISCRRQTDGGHWAGTESERQVLLRSAIVSGVDYVDLEWDIAKMIPRYGNTKRVISYINQQETPGNLSEILQNILECDPDIVRIATKANNLNDWLRVSLLIKRAPKPTTAICLGELGMATRLLGERWGSPLTFTMSPLGRKLQPWEVSWGDIRHVYGIEHINQETELFALVGSEVQRSHEIVMLNALMRKLQLNACCMRRNSALKFVHWIAAH